MYKKISWKGSLLIALICYSLKFIIGASLGRVPIAVLEIVGLITLILGIIGGIKAVFNKRKSNK